MINYSSAGLSSSKIFLNTLSTKTNKNNYPYLSDVTFYLNSPIKVSEPENQFLISVSDLIIPISWPQISTYLNNNYISYSVNNVSYTYTIPDGSYTVYQLITQLTGNLNGITIVYSATTNKLAFSHTTYNFTLNFNNSTCYQELGFYQNYSYSSTNQTLTSSIPIDLSGSREIYIGSNLTVKNIDSRDGLITSHLIDHVPIDVSNYDILKYINQTSFKTIIIDNNIIEFRIILYDDENNIIPILHNWSMTLELHEIKNIKLQNFNYKNMNDVLNNNENYNEIYN